LLLLTKQQNSTGPWTDDKLFDTARTVNVLKFQMAASSYMKQYYYDKNTNPLRVLRDYTGDQSWQLEGFESYPWKAGLHAVTKMPPTLTVEFSIGYQWHELLPGDIFLCNVSRGAIDQCLTKVGMVSSAFSADTMQKYGVEAILSGMAASQIPHFHSGLADELRNVKHPYGGLRDLAAWTIEHERERGLPTFNEFYGESYKGKVPIRKRVKFEDFTANTTEGRYKAFLLSQLYKTPDDVDLTVGQVLDEEYWPGTYVTRTAVASSLLSLALNVYNDRFSPTWLSSACLIDQKPWRCTPTTVLQELFWRKVTTIPWFDRLPDMFWVDELEMTNRGDEMLWKLIVQNTDLKCLQINVFWKENATTNPVRCYDLAFIPGPKKHVDVCGGTLGPFFEMAEAYGALVHYKQWNMDVLLVSSSEFLQELFEKKDFAARPTIELIAKSHAHILGSNQSCSFGVYHVLNGSTWQSLRAAVVSVGQEYGSWIPFMSKQAATLANVLGETRHSLSVHDAILKQTINTLGSIAFGAHFEDNLAVEEAFRYWVTNANQFVGKSNEWSARATDELNRHLSVISRFFTSLRNTSQPADVNIPTPWYYSMISKAAMLQPSPSWEDVAATVFDMFTHSLHSAFEVEYALYFIGANATLQELLYKEVAATGGVISISALHHMPLLMTTIKEVNRAFPTASGGLLARLSINTSTFARRLIPSGTAFLVNSLLVHHDADNYAEPHVFNPSRWKNILGTNLEALMDSHNNYTFLTYGAGQRSCPGVRFAFAHQAIMLAQIVRNVKMFYDGYTPPMVEFAFTSSSDVKLRFLLREHTQV
jgi:cytochrome P450